MKNSFRPAVLPLAVAAAFPVCALAAGQPEDQLAPVVVSAPAERDRWSSAGGGEDLPAGRVRSSDAAALLADLPGVSLYGAGGVSSLPAIHGLADDRVRVKVDGMDLISACANHMNPPLSYIDPTRVGAIKVFAGIAPVSSGGDAVGGTIAVDSAPPDFAAPGQGPLAKGEAGIFYRSNGNARGANLGATLAGEAVSFSYAASTAESGNYKAARDFKPAGSAAWGRSWLDGNVVGSTRYKSENQSFGAAVRHDEHLVELKIGVQNIPYQGFPNQRMDMTGNDSTQVNLRYTGRYAWGRLEARIYDERTRHRMNFGDDKQFWYGATHVIPGMPMDTEGRNAGALVKAAVALSERDTVTLGAEFQRYRLDDWWAPSGGSMAPNNFRNINDGRRDRNEAFAEWEARWNPRWLTLLGARVGSVVTDAGTVQGYNTAMAQYAAESAAFNARDRRRDDHNLDLAAIARYTGDPSRTIDFGYARKTRSPNLYERYTWSTGGMAMVMNNFAGDGNGYVGNLDLRPEVAHTLSASFDWHDAGQDEWGLRVTPYFTYVHDYIDARRCRSANAGCGAANQTATTGFVYLQFVNQEARLYGVDLSGHFPVARSDAYGRFDARGVVGYVRGENRTTGDGLYNIMPINAKFALVHGLGAWTNTAEVQLVGSKNHLSQVRNELPTGGYGLFNLRSSYAWKQARLDVGIDNVFNRFYTAPLAGAYVGQGMTMSTMPGSAPWGTPVPGMGRSAYLGLSVKF